MTILRTNSRLLSIAMITAPTTAFAHVGDHSDRSYSALIEHLLEWDHLAMIAGAAILAIVAFRKFKSRGHKTGVQ